MGLNSHGYRTDPGHQVVKVSLIVSHTRAVQDEVDAFLSSGELPPVFHVRWSEQEQRYVLRDGVAEFAALSLLGYNYVDVIVESTEKPLDDVLVERKEE